MAGAQVSMEVGNDGVAIITLSNPPVNDLDVPCNILSWFSEFSSNHVLIEVC